MDEQNKITEAQILDLFKKSNENNKLLQDKIEQQDSALKRFSEKSAEYDKILKITDDIKEQIKEPLKKIELERNIVEQPKQQIPNSGIFTSENLINQFKGWEKTINDQYEYLKGDDKEKGTTENIFARAHSD